LMAAALVVSSAAAADKADLATRVRHEILMYSSYSLWDDISFRVENGNVSLLGAVSQPYKKSDIERIVQHIPGVASVTNQVKVLPLSPEDDRLRVQVARAIFRDPALSRYAMGAVPAIHIIVDNGKVTLTGAVNNNLEKQVAGMRASAAGFSFGPVINNLTVDNPPAKKS
ncbi:MAG: BON domain-containing protein, partial [Candidatus Solibacter sp.]|nr:BON domain-containing protein [Candidatus Solibacter sp.]